MPTRHQLSRFPEHAKAIGLLAAETVDLELELALLFSRMLSLTPRVGEAIYMTPRGDQARIEMLQNAARELFAPRKNANHKSKLEMQKRSSLGRVSRLAKRARQCIDKRHRAMHDDWYISSETKEIKRVPVDGKGERVGTPMPIKTLTEDLKVIRVLIDDITALAKEFKSHPPRMTSMSTKSPVQKLR